MMIDRVHGLHATDISLNHRFTMLAASCRVMQPRRHVAAEMLDIPQNHMFEQMSHHLPEQLARRRALMQRLHMPATRIRRSSEGSIAQASLYRSNSFNSLRENFGKKLSRASSFNSLSEGPTGGVRWRRKMRSRGRMRVSQQWRLNGGAGYPQQQQQGQGRGKRRARSRSRGRGRRGRNRNYEPITKEKLDDEMDQYMASSKYSLDKELDEIRTNFIEFEDM